jgi:L-asparagine transporter-like permease
VAKIAFMTDYLNMVIKSGFNSFDSLTSPNIFLIYIFSSFSLFRFLANQAETVEAKLKMWKYNSYAFYILFLSMHLSKYIRNNPDRWLNVVIVILVISIVRFSKTRSNEKKIQDKIKSNQI